MGSVYAWHVCDSRAPFARGSCSTKEGSIFLSLIIAQDNS